MSKDESKELTLPERAAIALKSNDKELIKLAAESKDIVTVTNQDGFAQAQRHRMVLRNTRTDIEKRGKAAREDAQKFTKAIIEEEKRLIGLINPEENRLQSVQDEFTAKIEAEKQAKIDAEIKRKADIQAAIDELSANLQFGDTSASIQAKIDRITRIEITEPVFQERTAEANDTRNISLATLAEAFESVTAAEEGRKLQEAARIKAEQEAAAQREATAKAEAEATRIRAEADAKRQAEERAAAEAERKKLEEQQKAERAARIKAEQEAEKLRAEAKALLDAKRAEEAAKAEAERKAAAAPDKERMLAYAASLIALKMPDMATPEGKAAKVGIEQAVLNLHTRIVAKAEEL